MACPTGADLDRGVVFKSGSPSAPIAQVVRHLGGGLYWISQESEMFPDTWHGFYHDGMFQLFIQRESGMLKKVNRYAPAPAGNWPLSLGETYATLFTYGDPEGKQIWKADYTFTVEDEVVLTIGDCPYKAQKIAENGTLILPTGQRKQIGYIHYYFPELHYSFNSIGKNPAPLSLDTVGFWDDVASDAEIREMADDEPALAEILREYQIAP